MNHIKIFEDYNEDSLNEATKAIDVEKEQQNQSKYMDQIKLAKSKMSKIDATNKKQFEKTQEKAKLTQTIAKLTAMIANSLNKEAQALQALAKEQSKQ